MLASETAQLLKKYTDKCGLSDPACVASDLCDLVSSNDNMTMMIVTAAKSSMVGGGGGGGSSASTWQDGVQYLAGSLDRSAPLAKEMENVFLSDAKRRGNLNMNDPIAVKTFLDECVANHKRKVDAATALAAMKRNEEENDENEKETRERLSPPTLRSDWTLSLFPSAAPSSTKKPKQVVCLRNPLLGYGDGEVEVVELETLAAAVAKLQKEQEEEEEITQELKSDDYDDLEQYDKKFNGDDDKDDASSKMAKQERKDCEERAKRSQLKAVKKASRRTWVLEEKERKRIDQEECRKKTKSRDKARTSQVSEPRYSSSRVK
jgi:hypothetical protein